MRSSGWLGQWKEFRVVQQLWGAKWGALLMWSVAGQHQGSMDVWPLTLPHATTRVLHMYTLYYTHRRAYVVYKWCLDTPWSHNAGHWKIFQLNTRKRFTTLLWFIYLFIYIVCMFVFVLFVHLMQQSVHSCDYYPAYIVNATFLICVCVVKTCPLSLLLSTHTRLY